MKSSNLLKESNYKNTPNKVQKDETSPKLKKFKESVTTRKNRLLKNRLKTLILSKGMSEPEFFHSIDMTRQQWYYLSWGIVEALPHLKIRIAEGLNCDTSVIFKEGEDGTN